MSTAKAAGHELKGLINTFNTRVVANKIHYPLMALIDYRGFRLIGILSPVNLNIYIQSFILAANRQVNIGVWKS